MNTPMYDELEEKARLIGTEYRKEDGRYVGIRYAAYKYQGKLYIVEPVYPAVDGAKPVIKVVDY